MKQFDEAALAESYAIYHKCRIVAEQFGCSDETVRRALIKHNVPRVKKHKRPVTRQKATEEELKAIAKEYQETDATINDLSKKYKRAQYTVSMAAKEYGAGLKRYDQNAKKITDDQLRDACKTMSRMEIANAFGMHPETVSRRMQKIGCYGQKTQKDGASVFSRQGISQSKSKSEDKWHYVKSIDNWIITKHKDFEFVSYKNQRVKMRCKVCGLVIERSRSTVVQKGIRCEGCNNNAKLQRERQKLHDALFVLIESKTPKKCQACGGTFYSPNANKKYCSDRCKRKNKSNGNIRERCKKYGVEYRPGISLLSVYKRDNGICQLCGKPTDFADKSWNGSFGAMYPTIDHRLALANGGGHTWENVQLAHAICNSHKRDVVA